MFCPDCGQDNPGEARFCRACGAALEVSSLAGPVGAEAALAPVVYAGFWIRFFAWIIDTVIVWIGSGVFVALSRFGPAYTASLPVLLLGPLYFVLLTGLRGQTLGKMAVGVRVAGKDGKAPGLGYAALREIVGKFVSGFVFLLGFLWIGWDGRKQGWHDKIAGTFVVRVRR